MIQAPLRLEHNDLQTGRVSFGLKMISWIDFRISSLVLDDSSRIDFSLF